MDEVVLMQKIREDVRDEVSVSVLVQLVSLRNALREFSDPSALVGVISGSPLRNVDLRDLERVVETVEDEGLRKELGYLLNLGEDIKSGKLLRELLSLSEIQDRMHFLGYLSLLAIVLAALAYRFLSDDPNIKLPVLGLTSVVLIVCGFMFLKTLLSKRRMLKSFALRYKLK